MKQDSEMDDAVVETGDQPQAEWNAAKPDYLPRPTYWPFALALAVVLLAWGLISSALIFAGGVVLLVISLAHTNALDLRVAFAFVLGCFLAAIAT